MCNGDVVCAIADKKIYLSDDTGLTWTNISFNATLGGSVATDNGTSTPKIFYLVL